MTSMSLQDWWALQARYAHTCSACGTPSGLKPMQVSTDAVTMVETWEFRCACGMTKSMQAYSPAMLGPPAPEPAATPEPVPTISGSVIGYRAWRIQDWRLTGTYSPVPWVPGVNEAECMPPEGSISGLISRYAGLPPRHPAPALGCACGITALARFARHDEHWQLADVFGAIEAWSDEDENGDGRFVLHRNGFRAQFAKVVLLAVDGDWPVAKRAAVRALAQEHGADVCRREHLEDAAREHGQLVPDDLLAWAAEVDPEPVADVNIGRIRRGGVVPAQLWSPSASYYTVPSPSAPQPQRSKGIKQTLRHPGPPGHGKWHENDRVRDSRDTIWQCTKRGKPGMWEAET